MPCNGTLVFLVLFFDNRSNITLIFRSQYGGMQNPNVTMGQLGNQNNSYGGMQRLPQSNNMNMNPNWPGPRPQQPVVSQLQRQLSNPQQHNPYHQY